MKNQVFLLVIGLGAIAYCAYRVRRRRGIRPEAAGGGAVDLPVPESGERQEKIIRDYFDALAADKEESEIKTFYSYQFDLKEYKKPYSRRVKAIAGLSELGLEAGEIDAGNAILIREAGRITKGRPLSWSASLIFLMDYAEISGRIGALESIDGKIPARYRDEALRQMEKLKEIKDNLIERYR